MLRLLKQITAITTYGMHSYKGKPVHGNHWTQKQLIAKGIDPTHPFLHLIF